jgi:signal transduction histidine kinase
VPSKRVPRPTGRGTKPSCFVGRGTQDTVRRLVVVDDHAKAATKLSRLSEIASERASGRVPETIERVLEAAREELGMEVAFVSEFDQQRMIFQREATVRARAHKLRRIGRELHDRVAHTMTAAYQSLQLYEEYRDRDPERAAQKLELAKRMTTEAMEETQDLARAMREPEGEELEAALSKLLLDVVPPEMDGQLSVVGDEGEVSDEVREQLFFVLREAVRNAVSHSGASKVSVGVRVDRERVVGVVEDDGRGFDRKQPERAEAGGLAYMAERASLLGGTCSIESVPGEGTRVETSFPLSGA